MSQSKTTVPKEAEEPDNVVYWDDFETYFERFNQIVDQCETKKYKPVDVPSLFRRSIVRSHNELQENIIRLGHYFNSHI